MQTKLFQKDGSQRSAAVAASERHGQLGFILIWDRTDCLFEEGRFGGQCAIEASGLEPFVSRKTVTSFSGKASWKQKQVGIKGLKETL